MRALHLLVVVGALALGMTVRAQPPAGNSDVPWGPAASAKTPFLRLLLPNKLAIDMPGREGQDWHASGGYGTVLLIAVERKKGEASAWIDAAPYRLMEGEVSDADLLDAISEDVKLKEPAAVGVRQAVVRRDGLRFVYSAFSRTGISLEAERVHYYLFPTPSQTYRFFCVSAATVEQRYAAICGHMAWSFASSLPAAAGPVPTTPR